MDMKMKAAAIALLLFLNGCATATKSTLLGAAIGVTAGGAIGQASSQNSTGTAVGALIGAGLGSLIGYAAYSDKQKKEATVKPKTETGEDLTPFLTKPRVRSYIVPDTI